MFVVTDIEILCIGNYFLEIHIKNKSSRKIIR